MDDGWMPWMPCHSCLMEDGRIDGTDKGCPMEETREPNDAQQELPGRRESHKAASSRAKTSTFSPPSLLPIIQGPPPFPWSLLLDSAPLDGLSIPSIQGPHCATLLSKLPAGVRSCY